MSGFIANQNESNIFFRGVTMVQQEEILRYTGFKKGELPFRYLGVPLNSKKLTISQRQPMSDRIMQNIQTWSVKFLSYVGRLQLISSVLLSIQIFGHKYSSCPRMYYSKWSNFAKDFCGIVKSRIEEKH